jgi:hypothetical protein
MSTTDVLAIIGAVTGTIGTISGVSAIGWDYYKWKKAEKVNLRVKILTQDEQRKLGVQNPVKLPDLVRTPEELEQRLKRGNFIVQVVNVGKNATTLTAFGVQNYKPSFFDFIPRRQERNYHFIEEGHSSPLPFVLEPGRIWLGVVNETEDYFQRMVVKAETYAVLIHSLSERPILVHIHPGMWINA